MTALPKKVLPFEFRACNQDQQACRPAGQTRMMSSGDSKGSIVVQKRLGADDPLASDFSNLSPPEVAIFKIRTQELMAIMGKGRMPVLTPAQWKVKGNLTALCGDICSVQLTPLRVLRVKIVALLTDPALAKCAFKKTAIGFSDSGTLAVQTLPEFIQEKLQMIVKGLSLLERHLVNRQQETYDGARGIIDEAIANLRTAEIQSPSFNQALELAGHLQVCLADKKALFPFLLTPLGSCVFKDYELNSDLFQLGEEALQDLLVCLTFFKSDIKAGHKLIREKLGKAELPQKGSFKEALRNLETAVDEFCTAFDREAMSLRRSPEMSLLAQHLREICSTTFNTAEIGKVKQLFASVLGRVESLNQIYQIGLERFSSATKVIDSKVAAMPSVSQAAADIKQQTIRYNFFDFYVRDFFHIFRLTTLPLQTAHHQYGRVEDAFRNIHSLTLRTFDSQHVTNADLLFLTLNLEIAVLDRLSRESTHQQAVYNLYIHTASLIGSLEEAFLTLRKKGVVNTPKNPIERFQEHLLACIAFCRLLAERSPCKDEPAFKEALNKIEAVVECLRKVPLSEELSDATTRMVVNLSFMPIGKEAAFTREFCEYLCLLPPLCVAYADQFQDLAEDLQARAGSIFSTIPNRLRKPVKNMVAQVAAVLTSFKAATQSLPPPNGEKEASQHVVALLNWLQKLEAVDVSVFDEACSDIVAFVDRTDAFPDGAIIQASLAQFQVDLSNAIQNVTRMVAQLHRPLFSWSKISLFEETPLIASPRSRAVIEEDVEDVEEAKGAVLLPPSQAVEAPKRVTSLRPFSEIEAQMNGLLFLLSKVQHPEPARKDRMKIALSDVSTHVIALREEFLSHGITACPFTHVATLYSETALMAEQALKFLLVQHVPDQLEPYEDLLASHDLFRLLQTILEIKPQFVEAVHPRAVEMMGDIQGICLSGRYLEDAYGTEADVLKGVARLAALRKRATLEEAAEIDRDILQLVRTGKQQVLRALTVVADLLSASEGAGVLLPVEPQKAFQLIMRPDAHPRLIQTVERMGILRRRIEVNHLTAQQAIRYGNTAGNVFHDQMRIRQIVRALTNMQYYSLAVNELLTTASSPHTSYNKTNALLLNTSLLLEQACLSIIAYLDIPGENSPLHVLFETVNPQGRPRPRAFDHNVENLFKIIQRFAAQTAHLPPFVFSEGEVAAISLLSKFIGVTSRYLSSANGPITEDMRELRDLSELLYVVETGFRTEPQEAALKARFGNQESEWKNKILAAVADIQERRVFPLVARVLTIVEKLMQFNLNLCRSRPARDPISKFELKEE